MPIVGRVDVLIHALNCLPPVEAAVMVESALRRGDTTKEFLLDRLQGNRNGPARAVLDLVTGAADSALEVVARIMLVRAGIHVEEQVRIEGVGRVDFLLEGFLVLEVDGDAFHSDRRARTRDRKRNNGTILGGYLVLRYGYEDIMFHADAVLAEVLAMLRGRPVRQYGRRAAPRPLAPPLLWLHPAPRSTPIRPGLRPEPPRPRSWFHPRFTRCRGCWIPPLRILGRTFAAAPRRNTRDQAAKCTRSAREGSRYRDHRRRPAAVDRTSRRGGAEWAHPRPHCGPVPGAQQSPDPFPAYSSPPRSVVTPSPPPSEHAAPRPLGVAMIGYAFMGKAHSAAWRTVGSHFDVPPVTRRVVVGRDAEKTAEAAARYGWEESAADWREVIAREDIDIVDVCTPGYLHAEIAIEALKAGKHVLVEKPLANSLTESAEMVAAAAAARVEGVQSMVGFNYRRVPALAHARQLIADGRIGGVRHLRVAYLQDWLTDPASPMTWRLRKETAGSGALGDIASHALDQVQFLTGELITEVSGRLHTFVEERPGEQGPEPVTVDDAAWITAVLAGGAIASVEVSRVAAGVKNGLRIEVFGERGALRFELENLNELWFMETSGPATEQGFRRILVTEPGHPYLEAWWPPGHIIGWEHTFTHQLRDFLTAIRTGEPTQPSFEAGLQLQRVLAAVEESAAARSVVVTVGSDAHI